jgi:hypothetical protein
MLSTAQIDTLKRLGADLNNPFFQQYIKSETTPKHVCPYCKAPYEDYIPFRHHILTKHADKFQGMTAEEEKKTIDNILNPLNRVRLACDMKKDGELLTMGKFFCDIITSTHNQHALVNIIGKTGMGKSNAAMAIGLATAKEIANKIGGKPEDYFNIDNIAIMKLDSIIPIIEDLDQKKYNIIILDDIGASYSARDFQKAINKNINKIFQTFRDTNTLVILTMPDTFLIDKVARKLAHYQIEIIEKRHDQGLSIGKLVQLVEQYRNSSKTHYHFIVDKHGIKYTRVVFKRVHDDLANQYEAKRTAIRASMQQNSIKAIRDSQQESESGKIDYDSLPAYQKHAPDVDIELTLNPQISCRALGAKLGISKDTAARAKEYVLKLRQEKAAQTGEVYSQI